MPLYEYICPNCGKKQDHVHNMEAPIPNCMYCSEQPQLQRVWSGTAGPKTTSVKGSRIGEPFFDMREVHALHGKNWRETSKETKREGGERKALYFHD